MTLIRLMKQIRKISCRKFIIIFKKLLHKCRIDYCFIYCFHLITMSDGIVLQTQFLVPPNNAPSNPSIPSIVSLTSTRAKKKENIFKYVVFGIFFLFLLAILILVAIIVGKIASHSAIPISSESKDINQFLEKQELSPLVNSILLEHMFTHLRQFGSREMSTISFNRTVDYLKQQLDKENNNFIVQKYYFSVPRLTLGDNPILMILPNTSNASIFTYPKDFVHMDRSTEARNWSLVDGRPLSIVTRLGCYLDDWKAVKEGDVALVKRGNCTFVHKILLAMNKRAGAFLMYNDGLTYERLEPLNNTRAPRNNTIPTLFLSYDTGMRLISENVSRIYIRLEFRSLPPAIVTNICADTKFGNPNQTIVVGSHSDSVAAGNSII